MKHTILIFRKIRMTQPVTFRVDELSLQPLLTFCRVHELQSHSAAARELGLSVPTA